MTKDSRTRFARERARAERLRRHAAKKAALETRIEAIRVQEHKAGFDKGVEAGGSIERGRVLEHAAVHYKAGRDVQASAVREVFRELTARANFRGVAEEKKA